MTAELLLRSDAGVGREPCYDARSGELSWVDQARSVWHRTSLADGTDIATPVDRWLGSVVPRQGGGFAAAVDDGLATFAAGSNTPELVIRELPRASERMVGARCDARGRLWASSATVGFGTGCGTLRRWDGGQQCELVREDLTLPAGVAWSPDNLFCYVLDAAAGRLFVSVFDLDEGQPSHPRLLVQFGPTDGQANALCVDSAGCLWVALAGPGELGRYAQDGRELDRYRLPVRHPSGCAFGPGRTLLVTSTRLDRDPEPLAGSVFVLDAGVDGLPSTDFSG